MTFWSRARGFLNRVRANSAKGHTAVRQVVELRKQILSLYALLASNACALGYTHHDLAPAGLTVALPGVLLLLCLVRGIYWWRLRPEKATEAEAVRLLRLTTALTVVLSAVFVGWAMALNQYGGPFEQGQVAIFVAITVVACIFCLTHLPIAAFLVTGIVMGVFLVYCVTSGNRVFVAIGLNVAFVTVVMVRVLAGNFTAFIQLLESQAEAQHRR
jgi:predicted signal transduction protein with EAL and GGDEF domain